MAIHRHHNNILQQRQVFKDRTGFMPDVLLVAPNMEMDLNDQGIKVGTTYAGMRVTIAELDGVDFSVGLLLPIE